MIMQYEVVSTYEFVGKILSKATRWYLNLKRFLWREVEHASLISLKEVK